MKRTPRQLRLDGDTDKEVKKIADVTGLSQIEIIRQAVRAGVQAIKDNNYKLPLPLKLQVVAESEASVFPPGTSARVELNEPRPKK